MSQFYNSVYDSGILFEDINPNLGADTSYQSESDLPTEEILDTTSEDGSDNGEFTDEENLIINNALLWTKSNNVS